MDHNKGTTTEDSSQGGNVTEFPMNQTAVKELPKQEWTRQMIHFFEDWERENPQHKDIGRTKFSSVRPKDKPKPGAYVDLSSGDEGDQSNSPPLDQSARRRKEKWQAAAGQSEVNALGGRIDKEEYILPGAGEIKNLKKSEHDRMVIVQGMESGATIRITVDSPSFGNRNQLGSDTLIPVAKKRISPKTVSSSRISKRRSVKQINMEISSVLLVAESSPGVNLEMKPISSGKGNVEGREDSSESSRVDDDETLSSSGYFGDVESNELKKKKSGYWNSADNGYPADMKKFMDAINSGDKRCALTYEYNINYPIMDDNYIRVRNEILENVWLILQTISESVKSKFQTPAVVFINGVKSANEALLECRNALLYRVADERIFKESFFQSYYRNGKYKAIFSNDELELEKPGQVSVRGLTMASVLLLRLSETALRDHRLASCIAYAHLVKFLAKMIDLISPSSATCSVLNLLLRQKAATALFYNIIYQGKLTELDYKDIMDPLKEQIEYISNSMTEQQNREKHQIQEDYIHFVDWVRDEPHDIIDRQLMWETSCLKAHKLTCAIGLSLQSIYYLGNHKQYETGSSFGRKWRGWVDDLLSKLKKVHDFASNDCMIEDKHLVAVVFRYLGIMEALQENGRQSELYMERAGMYIDKAIQLEGSRRPNIDVLFYTKLCEEKYTFSIFALANSMWEVHPSEECGILLGELYDLILGNNLPPVSSVIIRATKALAAILFIDYSNDVLSTEQAMSADVMSSRAYSFDVAESLLADITVMETLLELVIQRSEALFRVAGPYPGYFSRTCKSMKILGLVFPVLGFFCKHNNLQVLRKMQGLVDHKYILPILPVSIARSNAPHVQIGQRLHYVLRYTCPERLDKDDMDHSYVDLCYISEKLIEDLSLETNTDKLSHNYYHILNRHPTTDLVDSALHKHTTFQAGNHHKHSTIKSPRKRYRRLERNKKDNAIFGLYEKLSPNKSSPSSNSKVNNLSKFHEEIENCMGYFHIRNNECEKTTIKSWFHIEFINARPSTRMYGKDLLDLLEKHIQAIMDNATHFKNRAMLSSEKSHYETLESRMKTLKVSLEVTRKELIGTGYQLWVKGVLFLYYKLCITMTYPTCHFFPKDLTDSGKDEFYAYSLPRN